VRAGAPALDQGKVPASGFLAFDLRDVPRALGPEAMGWLWGVSEVEAQGNALRATGPRAPELEALAVLLREMSKRAKGLFAQQAAHTAAKQEVTRELNELIKEGNAQVDFIKTGARVRYGKDSEKLVEFGVQPFRTRSRKAASRRPAPETAKRTEPTPDSAK